MTGRLDPLAAGRAARIPAVAGKAEHILVVVAGRVAHILAVGPGLIRVAVAAVGPELTRVVAVAVTCPGPAVTANDEIVSFLRRVPDRQEPGR
jgi:hypothetical protein